MQNAAFRSAAINLVYLALALPPDKLAVGLEAARVFGWRGLNITIPHKEAVLKYLDSTTPEAVEIGAVNTVVNEDGILTGYNTDGAGFIRSLLEGGFQPAGCRVVIIGAGGAARAVAMALARAGCDELILAGRTLSRASELAMQINRRYPAKARSITLDEQVLTPVLVAADLLVNASPVGTFPHHQDPPVIPERLLHARLTVSDLVYNPRETVLLRAAKAQGCRTVDGTGMLLHQGALAFELWTGKPAPVEIMRQELNRQLG